MHNLVVPTKLYNYSLQWYAAPLCGSFFFSLSLNYQVYTLTKYQMQKAAYYEYKNSVSGCWNFLGLYCSPILILAL